MIFRELALPGAYLIEMEPHTDERGHFARAWCREEFEDAGLCTDFVQGNVSINPVEGTLRGLHYQAEPHGEVKLIRCVRGAIFDVIVDVRPTSPTYLEWVGVELDPSAFQMIYVPEEFAHGFQTLEPETEVNYLVSEFFAPGAGGGIRYDDPALGIDWPRPVSRISDKDAGWPELDLSRLPSRRASRDRSSDRRQAHPPY